MKPVNLQKYISLFGADCQKPLHPFSEDKKDEVYYFNGDYYCKGRMKYIHDKNHFADIAYVKM